VADEFMILKTKLRFYHSAEHGTFVCAESMASSLEEAASHYPAVPLVAEILRDCAAGLRRSALRSENASKKQD